MAITLYNLKKWSLMLLGRSELHVHQGPGCCFATDHVAGYYNDLTHKLSDFHHPHGIVPRHPIAGHPEPIEFSIGIFQHGLGAYDLFLTTGDSVWLSDFYACANWALEHIADDGSWDTFSAIYPQAPYSAMAQGQGMSLLSRAYTQSGDNRYLQPLPKALSFTLSSTTLSMPDGGIVLLEYTNRSPVLNGWIFALWGLWDYCLLPIDHASARQLLDQTLETLKRHLSDFDTGRWTNYTMDGSISASTHYQRIHIAQMQALHSMTGDPLFLHFADRWQRQLNNPWLRLCAFGNKAVQKILEK